MSDSATLIDEILGGDRDFFFRPASGESTWRSIKSETSRMLGALPAAGREAYELQFRSRAERRLEQAIAAGDSAGVVAVARRWFHTPAGRRATLLAAIEALEGNQPLEAAAWLDRLGAAAGSDEFEPTLSVMRAVAWWRAGERATAVAIIDKTRAERGGAVRIGGRDVIVSFPAGGAAAWLESVAGGPASGHGRKASEWWLHRGDAARNALVTATRPLLVPRYRVPLTRHPEEARLLEQRRKQFADRDLPLLPSGVPLAVDGLLLAHTPMGLLAVDFETGKRVWLQTGGAAASFFEADQTGGDGDDSGDGQTRGALRGVFEDSTSGTLSSNGRLAFAVESDPASLTGPSNVGFNGIFRGQAPVPQSANVLSAYRIDRKGELAWRLPAAEPAAVGVPGGGGGGGLVGGGWYMGAPLPIGDQLFILVEEKGEIRLDVLSAADGRLIWSQPLAELDEDLAIGNRDSHLRRIGGLSPAFSEGVLVCPTGAGTAVAVDLATRTLLWAYNYPRPGEANEMLLPNGVRIRRGNVAGNIAVFNGQITGSQRTTSGWRDSSPILAGGRIVLTPRESEEIHCLDLRSGAVSWKRPRRDGIYVAGVVNGQVVVVGRRGVESLALADGANSWEKPLAFTGGGPSGRGILAEGRLHLPLDTPEVIEINLADGTVAGRSAARGGAVVGNLVAYRGEVVSQGVDSLDVFHQSAALLEKIDTAAKERPADVRMLQWRGQLDIDSGDIGRGLATLRAAHAADPAAVPLSIIRDALLRALERDFATAVPLWREFSDTAGGGRFPEDRIMLRVVVDGFLKRGDLPDAWAALQRYLQAASAGAMAPEGGAGAVPLSGRDTGPGELVLHGSDPLVAVTEQRWVQGRLKRLFSQGSVDVRAEIDRFGDAALAAARNAPRSAEQAAGLAAVATWYDDHPAGVRARAELVGLLPGLIDFAGPASDTGRDLAIRREFLTLGLRRQGIAVEREEAGHAPVDVDAAWPFGRIVERRGPAGRGGGDEAVRIGRVVPIPVDDGGDSLFPGLRLAYDMQQPSLVASDGFGRRIGEAFGFETNGRFDGMVTMFQPMATEASVVGRVVVARSGSLVAAFELSATPGQKHRRLWSRSEAAGNGIEMQMPFMGRAIGGRQGRLANIPLGMRISEPDEALPQVAVQGARARLVGVPILIHSSLQLLDPASGSILWERHRLPAGGELIGDDDYVCICPANGKQAAVVSMTDGELVRVCDIPRRDRRLMACGRRIVVMADGGDGAGGAPPSLEGTGLAISLTPVALQLLDPATLTTVPLGTFASESRVAPVGPERLAVLEPSGSLTILDLVNGTVCFRCDLPDMPRGLEQLRVIPWQDRYLVCIGRQETAEERALMEKVGAITNLPQQASVRDVSQPATGAVWAVDRTTGAMLWPVPATVLRHCLHPNQPEGLPVLLFARQIQPPRGGDRSRMSVLCLDKRTGQAACVDDKIAAQSHMLFGCDMIGDPAGHTVAIGRGGSENADVILEFTAQPTAPRPPFQAAARQPAARDVLSELEYWIEKAFLWPAQN